MKIKSKFKDYYDYVSHIYGGGDPNVVYVRDRLVPTNCASNMCNDIVAIPNKKIKTLPDGYLRDTYDFYNHSFKWCVIAGCYYLIVSENNSFPEKWEVVHENSEFVINNMEWWKIYYRNNKFGEYSDYLVELSRELNAPVFTIDGTRWNWKSCTYDLIIDANIPILANIGFPSVISPEQMYQDIAYFVGNKINECPDTAPPPKPPMTDKEKLLSHGFDNKQSFRHRVK